MYIFVTCIANIGDKVVWLECVENLSSISENVQIPCKCIPNVLDTTNLIFLYKYGHIADVSH